MKVVILAGGRGSRLSEETHLKPKPMIEIGSNPILWHIMKIYSYYGFNDFIVCCGYKGEMIKDYFTNYYMRTSDLTVDMSSNSVEIHKKVEEPWKVTLVDTGAETNTAGRVMRIRKYLDNDPFMLTYGDGVSNVDINAVLKFHRQNGKVATITAAKPAGRWGTIQISESSGIVETFQEKNKTKESWVNSGFALNIIFLHSLSYFLYSHFHNFHGALPLFQYSSKTTLSLTVSIACQNPKCLYASISPSATSLS